MFKIHVKNVDATLSKAYKEVLAARNKIIGDKCENLVSDLKEATPVDTGNARDNWKVVPTGDPKRPFKIDNLVPYIQYLNQGSSKQAPAYFIESVALRYGKPIGQIVQIKDPDRP